MSVVIDTTLTVAAKELGTGQLGTPVKNHLLTKAVETLSGVADDTMDLIWSDTRTPAGTDNLDLRGSLTDAFGTVLNFVEVAQIDIINSSTVAMTIGNGTNGAFSGLFAALNNTLSLPAGGELHWRAPKHGTGLLTTAGTADILKIALASGSYSILIAGRSA